MKDTRNKIGLFNVVNGILLVIFALLVLYPFYNSVLISIVPENEYIKNPFMLIPKSITFDSFKYVLEGTGVFKGYLNTFFLLIVGVPIALLITLLAGYVFSRPRFFGKRAFVSIAIFTMFFNGGVVPLYLLLKDVHLTDSLMAIIIIGACNTFYVILARSYFEGIPISLEESAKLDGANDIVVFFKIMLPLAKPIIATLTLFIVFDKWNEWFWPMLLLKDNDKYPLQLILRNIVFTVSTDSNTSQMSHLHQVYGNGIKMASIVITMTPIMCVYPIIQKYFVKGVMIGAVKD